MREDVPRMVALGPGSIVMRDDRKRRQWGLEIEPMLLGAYPVTQAEYQAVMGCNPSSMLGSTRPVDGVSWEDAIVYCNGLSDGMGLERCYREEEGEVIWSRNAMGYRLPTDGEWEHACRAGGGVRHGVLEDIAWFEENSDGSTHPVGQKSPNAWGLYDMLGNVWEWCWDVYDPEVYRSYRVFRGGGWADAARGCLASNRRRSHPTYRIDDLGFRVARSLPTPTR